MTVYAYRCDCGLTRDVRRHRDSTEHVLCVCGARMRRDYRTIQVSPQATPNRRNTNPTRTTAEPSWERGVVTVQRGDMRAPLIHSGGRPVRVKEYEQHRHTYEAVQRDYQNRESPLPNVR